MGDNDESELFAEAIAAAFVSSELTTFNSIQSFISSKIGRNLTKLERSSISKTLLKKSAHSKNNEEESGAHLSNNKLLESDQILLCTAYTTDYAIGDVCCHVNRAYSARHGYGFLCEKMPYEDMLRAIQPRTHCTWFKAKMILEELQRCILLQRKRRSAAGAGGGEGGERRGVEFIVWIDADAMVINQDVRLQDVVRAILEGSTGLPSPADSPPLPPLALSSLPDLIASADLSPRSVYPLNAGVLLVRVSEWSLSLWEDVWSHPASMRYSSVYFYEQSALVKCLRMRHISLSPPSNAADRPTQLPPPFLDIAPGGEGQEGVSVRVPHVVVAPCVLLNSNRIDAARLLSSSGEKGGLPPVMAPSEHTSSWTANDADLTALDPEGNSLRAAQFIFHAVGQWNKLGVVRRVAELYGLLPTPSTPTMTPTMTPEHASHTPLPPTPPPSASSSSPSPACSCAVEHEKEARGAATECCELSGNKTAGVVGGRGISGLEMDVTQFRLRRGKCGGIVIARETTTTTTTTITTSATTVTTASSSSVPN